MNTSISLFVKKALRFFRLIAQYTLPVGASRTLMSMYGSLTTRETSYSQYGEDLIIKAFFDALQLKNGTYCDIGCFHPIWRSNTHLLHKLGWQGICVDIDDFKLSAMKARRGNRVICIMAAITGDADRGAFTKTYRFKNRLWSEIDTIDKITAEVYKKSGAGPYRECVSPTMHINKLLDELPAIDFLNIDIEGVDEEVMIAIDFSVHRPKLVIFEDNTTWGGGEKITGSMKAAEYTRLFVSGGSVGYIDKRVTIPKSGLNG